ncbi:MAG: glycosyltransferase family 4 protein [Candidatus Bathyarchaeota archaeon]|nr:glycosyltransferase family 4 protein [Candidatus Bathyarchaeota archaeon]
MAHPSICIVTHTFLPHVGGIERVVYEQSKRLMQKQFKLMVLTNRIGTEKNYIYDGIKVRCYDSLNIGFRLGIPYVLPSIDSYKTFLTSVQSSDIIHAHGHPYLSSLIAAKLAKRYKKPFVLTQHNTFIQYQGAWNTVERLNDIAVGAQVLKAADKIIVVSNATRNYVLSLGADAEKTEVLHNGVDLDRFKPQPATQKTMRRKLEIPSDAAVALTVRRLVYKNGIDTLVESAGIAIKKNPHLVYLVVGGGPDFAEVKAKARQLGIEKNFKLAGFISDRELPSYYNAADFFVLPSKSGEGLPLVALEAMACGLPVIATNVGGIKEIMVGGFGEIVPPNNPESLAETIAKFSNSEFSSRKNELRRKVEQKFSWDTNVKKLVEIYEELI